MMLKRENMLMLGASFLIAIGARVALAPSIAVTREQIFDATLEFRNLPDSLTVLGENLTVEMKATGTAQQLDQLDKSTVRGVVDLSFAKTGQRRYVLEVEAPTRTRVQIEPRFRRIWLDVQKVSSKEQVVEVDASGQIGRDYVYDGASILPHKVTIVGPESSLPKVKSARVSLDLNQVRPGTTLMLPVEVVDETNRRVPYVHAQPSEVSVSPAVVAAPAIKRVLVTASFVGQPAFGYRVVSYEVRPTQIEVRGESEAVSRTTTVSTEEVNLEGLKQNGLFKVKVKLPTGLRVTVSNEVLVSVRVEPTSR